MTVAAGLMLCALNAGCQRVAEEEEQTAPFEGVTVRVHCAAPGLQGFLEDAANEWALTTGANVVFDSSTGTDIVVFPLSEAGTVAAERMLSTVPEDVYEPDPDAPRDWPEPVRENLCHWGTVECFVPLSVKTYVLLVRTDLVPEVSEETLQTWRDLDKLIEARKEDTAILVPDLTTAWLLRAASYVRAPGSFAFFFDPWKGTPLVQSPGFLRALEDWLSIKEKIGIGDARSYAQGQIPFAIVASDDLWPVFGVDSAVGGKTTVLSIPGAEQYFNRSSGEWATAGGLHRVSWLDATVAAVAADSKVSDAAFDYLRFCSTPDTSIRGVVDPLAPIAPFRLSHFRRTGKWAGAGWNVDVMGAYFVTVQETLGNRLCVEPLQVREGDRFMEVMRGAVRKLWESREAVAAEAVEEVARRWSELMEELGKENIQEDYRRSVGLVGLEYMLPEM